MVDAPYGELAVGERRRWCSDVAVDMEGRAILN